MVTIVQQSTDSVWLAENLTEKSKFCITSNWSDSTYVRKTSQISKQIFVKMHTTHVYNRSTVELPVSKTRIKHIVTIILTSRVCFINAIVRCSFELKPCRLSGVFSRCDLTTSCQISKSFVMMWCSGYSIRKCFVPRTERVLLYFNLSQIANTPRWWKLGQMWR